jgi:hypothetical protein
MARSEARLQFGMWRAGLSGLGPHAKLLYAVLLTEPTLNHCGIGAIRLSRWAKDASLTIAETEKALAELRDGNPLTAKIVVDDDTDEVFVRTLIRNDGVADQPYVLKGALREAVHAQSPLIRWVLAAELRKLPARQPDGLARNGRKVVYPDPHAAAEALSPEGSPPPPGTDAEDDDTENALFSANPFERVSSDSSTEPKRVRGGGGGGGISSCVATSVESSAAPQATPTPKPDTQNKIAQRLARTHYDNNPLTPFVAVMKICKRALDGGYAESDIAAALVRLAAAKRSVTADSLRIELDGPPLRAVVGGHVPWRNPTNPDAYDEPMFSEEGQ